MRPEVIDDPDISLNCFDDVGRRAVFVKLPLGIDLTKSPFIYLTQGERAECLVAVPYDAFLQLAAELPGVEHPVLIYISGRSGSTLLSHSFNQLDTVTSLSEPDVANQFAYLRDPDGSRDAELGNLIGGTVSFLSKPNLRKVAPNGQFLKMNASFCEMLCYSA